MSTTLSVDARKALAELKAVEDAALRARSATDGVGTGTAVPTTRGPTIRLTPLPTFTARRTSLPVTEAAISAAGLRTLNSGLFPTLAGRTATVETSPAPPRPNTAPPIPGIVPPRPAPVPQVTNVGVAAGSAFDPTLSGAGLRLAAFQFGAQGLVLRAGSLLGPALGVVAATKGAEILGNEIAAAGRQAALAALTENRNFAEAAVGAAASKLAERAVGAAESARDLFTDAGAGILRGAVGGLGVFLSGVDSLFGTGQNQRIAREIEEALNKIDSGADTITGRAEQARQEMLRQLREGLKLDREREAQLRRLTDSVRQKAGFEADSHALELLGLGYPGELGAIRSQVLSVIEEVRVRDAESRFNRQQDGEDPTDGER